MKKVWMSRLGAVALPVLLVCAAVGAQDNFVDVVAPGQTLAAGVNDTVHGTAHSITSGVSNTRAEFTVNPGGLLTVTGDPDSKLTVGGGLGGGQLINRGVVDNAGALEFTADGELLGDGTIDNSGTLTFAKGSSYGTVGATVIINNRGAMTLSTGMGGINNAFAYTVLSSTGVVDIVYDFDPAADPSSYALTPDLSLNALTTETGGTVNIVNGGRFGAIDVRTANLNLLDDPDGLAASFSSSVKANDLTADNSKGVTFHYLLELGGTLTANAGVYFDELADFTRGDLVNNSVVTNAAAVGLSFGDGRSVTNNAGASIVNLSNMTFGAGSLYSGEGSIFQKKGVLSLDTGMAGGLADAFGNAVLLGDNPGDAGGGLAITGSADVEEALVLKDGAANADTVVTIVTDAGVAFKREVDVKDAKLRIESDVVFEDDVSSANAAYNAIETIAGSTFGKAVDGNLSVAGGVAVFETGSSHVNGNLTVGVAGSVLNQAAGGLEYGAGQTLANDGLVTNDADMRLGEDSTYKGGGSIRQNAGRLSLDTGMRNNSFTHAFNAVHLLGGDLAVTGLYDVASDIVLMDGAAESTVHIETADGVEFRGVDVDESRLRVATNAVFRDAVNSANSAADAILVESGAVFWDAVSGNLTVNAGETFFETTSGYSEGGIAVAGGRVENRADAMTFALGKGLDVAAGASFLNAATGRVIFGSGSLFANAGGFENRGGIEADIAMDSDSLDNLLADNILSTSTSFLHLRNATGLTSQVRDIDLSTSAYAPQGDGSQLRLGQYNHETWYGNVDSGASDLVIAEGIVHIQHGYSFNSDTGIFVNEDAVLSFLSPSGSTATLTSTNDTSRLTVNAGTVQIGANNHLQFTNGITLVEGSRLEFAIDADGISVLSAMNGDIRVDGQVTVIFSGDNLDDIYDKAFLVAENGSVDGFGNLYNSVFVMDVRSQTIVDEEVFIVGGDDDSDGENPGGENPGGENPGGENPGGENPGGENPGGENPGGENPGGENPGGENPGGENPGGENPGSETPGDIIVVGDKTVEETMQEVFNGIRWSKNKKNGAKYTQKIQDSGSAALKNKLIELRQVMAPGASDAIKTNWDAYRAYGQLFGEYGAYAGKTIERATANFGKLIDGQLFGSQNAAILQDSLLAAGVRSFSAFANANLPFLPCTPCDFDYPAGATFLHEYGSEARLSAVTETQTAVAAPVREQVRVEERRSEAVSFATATPVRKSSDCPPAPGFASASVHLDRIWASPFGNWSKQNGRSGIHGYEYSGAGIALGYEYRRDGLTLGVAAAYTSGELKVKDLNAKYDGDILNAALYAGYLHESGFYANGRLGLGLGWNDYKVRLLVGGRKKGDFDNRTYTLALEGGYVFRLPDNVNVIPSIGFDFTHFSQDKWSEKGAGIPNWFAKRSDNWLRIPVAVKANKVIALNVDSYIIPEAKLGWTYQAKRAADRIRTGYLGAAGGTTMYGAETGRNLLVLGAGAKATFGQRYDAGLEYNFECGSGYRDHRLSATFGVSF